MTLSGQRQVGRLAEEVGPIVARVLRTCRGTFEPSIVLREEIQPDLPAIGCDGAAIERALLNVMLNARDAVLAAERAAPVIAVSVRSVTDAPSRRPGRYLQIAIRDDGIGMSPEVRQRIFEPFFTTKAASGLGLTASYAIIRRHGGWIDCASTMGEGTTLAVYLPVEEEIDVQAAPRDSTRESPRARVLASILIVDDEEAIRRVVGRMLRSIGYRVSTAASGVEALASMTEAGSIDIILLDRSMPSAPGHTLIEAFRQAAPAARLAYFTGHEVSKEDARAVDAVIRKPATIEHLHATITRLLG